VVRPVTVVPESAAAAYSTAADAGIEGLDTLGRHTPPNSASRWREPDRRETARVEKRQNQATKNITSEAMNRIMP